MRKITKIICCIFLISLILFTPFSSTITFATELKSCADVRLEEAKNWPSVVYCTKPIKEENHDGKDAKTETFYSDYCNGGYPMSCFSKSYYSEDNEYGNDAINSIFFEEGSFRCSVTAYDTGSVQKQKIDVQTLCLNASSAEQQKVIWSNWEHRTGRVETFQSPACPGDMYPISCLTKSDYRNDAVDNNIIGDDDAITSIYIEGNHCVITAYDTDLTSSAEQNRTVGVVCSNREPVITWSNWQSSSNEVDSFQSPSCPSDHPYPISCLTNSTGTSNNEVIISIYNASNACNVTAKELDFKFTPGFGHNRKVGVVCSDIGTEEHFYSNPTPDEDKQRDNSILGYHHVFYVNKPENSTVWSNHPFTLNGDGVNNANFNNPESLSPGFVDPNTGESITGTVAEWTGDGQKIQIDRPGSFILSSLDNHEISLSSDDSYVRLVGTDQCEDLFLSQTMMHMYQASQIAMEKNSNIQLFVEAMLSLQFSQYQLDSTMAPQSLLDELSVFKSLTTEGSAAAAFDVNGNLIDFKFVLGQQYRTALPPEILNDYWTRFNNGEIAYVIVFHNHPATTDYINSLISLGRSVYYVSFPGVLKIGPQGTPMGDISTWANRNNNYPGMIKAEGIIENVPDTGDMYFRLFQFKKTDYTNIEWFEAKDPAALQYPGQVFRPLYPEQLIDNGLVKELGYKEVGGKFIILPGLTVEMGLNQRILSNTAWLNKMFNDAVVKVHEVASKVSSGQMSEAEALNTLITKKTMLLEYVDPLEDPPDGWVLPQSAPHLKSQLRANLDYIDEIETNGFDVSRPGYIEKHANAMTGGQSSGSLIHMDILVNSIKSINERGESHIPTWTGFKEAVNDMAQMAADDIENVIKNMVNDVYIKRFAEILGNRYQTVRMWGNPFKWGYAPVAAKGPGAVFGFLTGFGLGMMFWSTYFNNNFAYEVGSASFSIGLAGIIVIYSYLGFQLFYSFIIFLITNDMLALAFWEAFFISFSTYFVALFVIGFFAALFFVVLLAILFPPEHFNCELDTPWYNNEQTRLREKVVRMGDTLHYAFYGIRYCYDENYYDYYHPDHLRFFVDLFYGEESFNDVFGNGTIFDLHTSYCTTLDGRCFDCSVNVTKPEPGIQEGHADEPGSFNATATWNDMQQSSRNYPSQPFINPIPILVCPEDKGLDESEVKCVDCNPDHTELGFCTGTNTASCTHSAEGDCNADPCCEYDYVYNRCDTRPRDWCFIFNNSVCSGCGCHMQSSGTCEEGCGASPECDERNPGDKWCDGSITKTCNSTCQPSEIKLGDLGSGVPPQFFKFDGKVDGKDLALFLQAFKGINTPPEAMNLCDLGSGVPPQFFKFDGIVNGKDLSLFLQAFKGLAPTSC